MAKQGVLLVRMLSTDDPHVVDDGSLRHCMLEGRCLKMWLKEGSHDLRHGDTHASIELGGNDWTVLSSRARREQFSLVSLNPNDNRIIRLKAKAADTQEWIDCLRAACDSSGSSISHALHMPLATNVESELQQPQHATATKKSPRGLVTSSISAISPFAPPTTRWVRGGSTSGARRLRFNGRGALGMPGAAVSELEPLESPADETLGSGNASPGIIFSSRKGLARCREDGEAEDGEAEDGEAEDGEAGCSHVEVGSASSRTASTSSQPKSPAASTSEACTHNISHPALGYGWSEPSLDDEEADQLVALLHNWSQVARRQRLSHVAGSQFYAWHVVAVTSRLQRFALWRRSFFVWSHEGRRCKLSIIISSSSSSSSSKSSRTSRKRDHSHSSGQGQGEDQASCLDRAFTSWLLVAAAGSPGESMPGSRQQLARIAIMDHVPKGTSRRLVLAWGFHRWMGIRAKHAARARSGTEIRTKEAVEIAPPAFQRACHACKDASERHESSLHGTNEVSQDVEHYFGHARCEVPPTSSATRHDSSSVAASWLLDPFATYAYRTLRRARSSPDVSPTAEGGQLLIWGETNQDQDLIESRGAVPWPAPPDSFGRFAYKAERRARSSPGVSPANGETLVEMWGDSGASLTDDPGGDCGLLLDVNEAECREIVAEVSDPVVIVHVAQAETPLKNSSMSHSNLQPDDLASSGDNTRREIHALSPLPEPSSKKNSWTVESVSLQGDAHISPIQEHLEKSMSAGEESGRLPQDEGFSPTPASPPTNISDMPEKMSEGSNSVFIDWKGTADHQEGNGHFKDSAVMPKVIAEAASNGCIPLDASPLASHPETREDFSDQSKDSDGQDAGSQDAPNPTILPPVVPQLHLKCSTARTVDDVPLVRLDKPIHISPPIKSDVLTDHENSADCSPGAGPDFATCRESESEEVEHRICDGGLTHSKVALLSGTPAFMASVTLLSPLPVSQSKNLVTHLEEPFQMALGVDEPLHSSLRTGKLEIFIPEIEGFCESQSQTVNLERGTEADKSARLNEAGPDALQDDAVGHGMLGAIWGPVQELIMSALLPAASEMFAVSPALSEGVLVQTLDKRHLQHWLEASPRKHDAGSNLVHDADGSTNAPATRAVSSKIEAGLAFISSGAKGSIPQKILPPPRPSRRDKTSEGSQERIRDRSSSCATCKKPGFYVSHGAVQPEDQFLHSEHGVLGNVSLEVSPPVVVPRSSLQQKSNVNGSPIRRRTIQQDTEERLRRALVDAMLADDSPAIKVGRSARLVKDVRKGMLTSGAGARKHGTRELAVELLYLYYE